MGCILSVGRVEGLAPMEALVVGEPGSRGLYRLVILDSRIGLPVFDRGGYPSIDMAEETAPGVLASFCEGRAR